MNASPAATSRLRRSIGPVLTGATTKWEDVQ